MATLTKVSAKKREQAIIDATADGKTKSLAGGLPLAIGEHEFTVADAKDAFGILNVQSQKGDKWALPIVAGTAKSKDGKKTSFVLSDKAGAATLVIPDNFFLEMQPNATYKITVELRGGNKRVTSVVPAEGEADNTDDEDDN